MSDNKITNLFPKENNEKPSFSKKYKGGFYFKSQYMEEYGLKISGAFLLSFLESLFSKMGFVDPSNEYLCKELNVDRKTIANLINSLKKKNLIYVHVYMTQHGKRREIVTRESAPTYFTYLKKHKKIDQLKKFEDEFSIHINKGSIHDKR